MWVFFTPDAKMLSTMSEANQQELYKRLPQLGELLDSRPFESLLRAYPREQVLDAARAVIANLRRQIAAEEHDATTLARQTAVLPALISASLESSLRPSLRAVINATGVILHTNLGRAPLSRAALDRVVEIASGYSNLELDLATGERGRRDDHVEALLLCLLPGTDAAVILNNCAAATFLALNSLAEGGEVIVSRGELVEIGGGFRIPDILRKSGAALRETGTTNRTHIADYEAAITAATRLILRVHQSNFKIEGFTARPSLAELVALGEKYSIPVLEDQGTGCIAPLEDYGLTGESSFRHSFESGVQLVAASGDKLLGGPQCGLLAGRADVVSKIKANPLLRAFRVDKMTYAALEATLFAYLAAREQEIPTLHMLRIDPEQIRQRCEAVALAVNAASIAAEVVPVQSVIGGGTTPGATLASFAVALRHASLDATALAATLRQLDPPIVARISEDRVLLDLRTVPADTDAHLGKLLLSSSEAGVAESLKKTCHPELSEGPALSATT